MELVHPPSVRRAAAYKPASTRRLLLLALVSVCYAVVGHFVYKTAGDPYRLAVEEFEALKLRHPEIYGPSSVATKSAEKAAKKIGGTVSSRQSLFDEFEDEEEAEEEAEVEVVEDVVAEAAVSDDVTERKGDDNSTDTDSEDDFDPLDFEEAPSMPPTFLPNAWAAAALFMLVTFHSLFHLMCHWSVDFRALALFEPVTSPGELQPGTSILMEPHAHRGSKAICTVVGNSSPGAGQLYFMFQRQRYDYKRNVSEEFSEGALVAGEEGSKNAAAVPANGGVTLMKCPVDLDVREYFKKQGLSRPEVLANQSHYGTNSLAIAQPKFLDLFKQQLVSPIAMFQFFTSLLWLMDEYWQYCLFSIFNVFMFESTTVFQRLKTMKTLDGMSSKSVPILVFRNRQWETTTTADLVPGDLISVCRTTTAGPPVAGRQPVAVNDSVPCDCLILRGSAVVNEATLTGESVPQMKDAASADYSADKKPLDIDGVDRVHVLFSGTSLINSTPTKQANSNSGGGGANRSAATHTEVDDIPAPPNNGCLCYVLRTGFNSSQGELVQMIEFSTQRVSSNNRETFMALGILLLFALVAAGYVLKKGLEKGDQTTHQLLLKCVIIVTSVVPQQLPMQMALAVNTALMQLMKSGIFCTEPFRVPYAGKIQHCLFDKTGTLSTDKLIPIGVVNTSASGKRGTVSRKDGSGAADAVVKDLGDGQFLVRVPHAAPAAAMVLAACHSLVQVNDTPPAIQATSGAKKAITDGPKQAELIGDPVELAALQGISWEYNAKRQEARPGGLKIVRAKLGECLKAIADHERTAPAATASADIRFAFNSKAKDLENQKNGLEALMAQTERRDANCPISAVRIQSRHHFASSLQRMSVVCNVTANARVAARRHRGKGDDANVAGSTAGEPEHFEGQFVLVKGSPEAIGRLLVDGGRPEWYESVYRSLAEDGMRVLALAYKSCQGVDGTQKSREWCESGLTFAGFISFACKTRTDSRMVVQALQESDHKVAMITGDAALTALHVARETGIVRQRDPTDASKPMPVLLLEPTFDGEGGAKEDAAHALARVATGARWVGVTGSLDQREGAARKFVAGEEMRKLSETNDLVVTMAGLEAGDVASDGQIWHDVDCIRVFARMTPQGKAEVIRSMQKHRGLNVLMCGDGGNDVGALKQANVGLALLSGYGDANTGDDDAVDTREDSSGTAVATQAGVTSSAEDQLNARAEKLKKKTVQNAARMKQEIKAMRTEVMSKQQQYVAAEKARLIAAGGQDGFMLTAKATVNVTKRLTAEVRTETLKIQRKYNVYRAGKDKGDGKGGVPSSIEDAMADAGLPIVKPGDASVAAPFTSRIPSVRSVVDLIRQGRCTMLSALQQQQIMMLECMIAAYTFSALTLEGARSSERQMMASGWLIMIASLAFSYATPIDKMHHVRPLHSLFHPSIFISIVGQVLIHLGCMVYGVRMATEYMGPELMKEVMRFHARQANADLLAEQALEAADPAGEDADPWADILSMWSKPFMPNLMNTVVFLVETSQLVAVLFVNYKGRPWMKGMTENHGLFLSVFICLLGVGLCAWGVFPAINAMIHLHPFPDDEFRWTVMGLCALSIGGTLLWDRLITAIFAPKIFGAMMESARATTWLDFWPAVKTMLMIVVGVGIFASGNVLLWGGAAYLYYRRRKANAEAALE